VTTSQHRPQPSRRARPAKAPLSRESIVATTLGLLDQGVERLTMRRVAAELDTGPASLYVYVRDTEELHTAVLEELLGTSGLLDTRPADTRSPREQLVDLLMRYIAMLMRYPSVARVTAFSRPMGPNYVHLVETLLDLLVRCGVPLPVAGWGVDLLLQQAETTAVEQGQPAAEQTENATQRAALRRLVAEGAPDLPHLVALGEDLVSGEGPERGAWSFEVLINGLLATPRPPVTDNARTPTP
jgi:AcrR family transcriptional regulator